MPFSIKTRTPVAGALVILGWAATLSAIADTLYLENGDRLTGTLVGANEGVLAFVTEYAGELAVQQDAVRGITTDSSFAFQTDTGKVIEGRLLFRDETQQVVVGEETQTLPFNNVAVIASDAEALREATQPPPEPEAPKEKLWSGSVDFGASVRSGTTDTLDTNVALKLVRERPRNLLTIDISGAYGAVENVEDTRRATGQAKWQVYPKERVYVYGLTGLEHDAFRKLDLRANAAAGVGYDFITRERQKLSADAGLDYAWERWAAYDPVGKDVAERAAIEAAFARLQVFLGAIRANPADFSFRDLFEGYRLVRGALDPDLADEIRTETDLSLRFSTHYEKKLFAAGTLTEDLVFLPSLDDLGEYRATSDLAFTTQLTDVMSLRLSLKTEYDSDPGQRNVEKLDNTFLTTLRYEF